jgi:hypothetical protein
MAAPLGKEPDGTGRLLGHTTAATVPPSVTVPAGATRATFPINTNQLTNAQSAVIIGTVGGVFSTEKHGIITVWDEFHFTHGSISILPGWQRQRARDLAASWH